MIARVMSADMEGLRRKGDAVAKALDGASEARITDANGTDLQLELSGREAIPDAGELTEKGAFGNLPCGEGFISPADGNGTLVVDGSMAGVGLVEEPVELVVEGGHLTSARGGQGMTFMELLTEHGEDGTNIAELGVGTNEKAILTGETPGGREDPRHDPRRVRSLGGDRGDGPGAGPSRLRGDEADARAGRRGDRPRRRAADPVSADVTALAPDAAGRRPNFSEGRSDRVIRALEATLGSARQGPQPPLRRPAQPLRLHDRGRAGQAGRGADRRCGARDRPDRHAPPPRAPSPHRGARRLPSRLADGGPTSRRGGRGEENGRGDRRPGHPGLLLRRARQQPGARRARLFPRGRSRRARAPHGVRASSSRTWARPSRIRAPGPRWSTAREPLVAFNVELDTPNAEIARAIAAELREAGGGLPGVRALGLPREGGARRSRSTSTIRSRVPLAHVVAEITRLAAGHGAQAIEAELVGLAPGGRPRGLPGRAADPGLRPEA